MLYGAFHLSYIQTDKIRVGLNVSDITALRQNVQGLPLRVLLTCTHQMSMERNKLPLTRGLLLRKGYSHCEVPKFTVLQLNIIVPVGRFPLGVFLLHVC